jgi:hypothetical protein
MTWTSSDIQDARERPLAPILAACGYRVCELRSGAFLVEDMGDLVVRRDHWFWRSKRLRGNPIDFFMLVEGRSFKEAMAIIHGDEDGEDEEEDDDAEAGTEDSLPF